MRSIAKTPPDSRPALLGWSLALGALSVLVAQGVPAPLDQQIAEWAAALRSPMLDGPMRALTWFGGSTWTLLGLSGLSAPAWRRGGWAAVRMIWLAFLLGAVIEVILRLSVAQWRPDTMAVPDSLDPFTHFELAGFPSGHAFRSAFVFGWISREAGGMRWERPVTWMCAFIIGAVGLTRLYLNRHWASDVLGAWLVVLTVLSLARWWEEKFVHSQSR